MKITMYELLGLIKDGKAPKTIKSEGHYYIYNELEKDYYEGMGYDYEYLLANTSVKGLDDKIEIIEDTPKEEKKIPEKLDHLIEYDIRLFDDLREYVEIETNDLFGKVNKIIDTLNQLSDYLKSKGE